MPTKKALERRRVTLDELSRFSYEPRVQRALESYQAFKAQGIEPEVWFSEFNGYDVFDPTERAVTLARLHRETMRG